MFQQNVRRFLTVGILACVLFMAGPGSAQARDLRSPSGSWGWLQALWSQGISWMGGGYGTTTPTRPTQRSTWLQKQGPGADPNGLTTPGSSNSATTSSPDQGSGSIPNG